MFEDDFDYDAIKDMERIKLKIARIEQKLDRLLDHFERHGDGTPGLWAKGASPSVIPLTVGEPVAPLKVAEPVAPVTVPAPNTGNPPYPYDKVMYATS